MLRAVYEGIWDEKFEVLANLRGSDVGDGTVKLTYNDGECNDFAISQQLSNDLKIVAAEKNWYRVNGRGSFCIPIYGRFEDSVFKVERRNNLDRPDLYMFSYRRKLISITKEYVNYSNWYKRHQRRTTKMPL